MRKLRILFYVAIFFHIAAGFPPIAHLFGTVIINNMTFEPNDLVLGCLYLWLLFNFSKAKRTDLHQRPIFLFMLWGIVPLVVGWLNGNSNLFSFLRFFAWGVLALTLPLAFESFDDLYRFIKYYLSLHSIRVLYYIVFEVAIPGRWFYKFEIYDRFDVFACAILLVAISQFKEKTNYEKLLCYAILPLTFLLNIIDQARTIYILFFVMVFLYLILGNKIKGLNIKKFAYISLLPIIIILLFKNIFYDPVYERFESLKYYQDDMSITFRIDALKESFNKIMESPVWGYGFGVDNTIPEYLPAYDMWVERTPHNFYIETALWGGSATLIIYLWLQLIIINNAVKTYIFAPYTIAVLLMSEIIIMITDLIRRFPSPSAGEGSYYYWIHPTIVLILIKLIKNSQHADNQQLRT